MLKLIRPSIDWQPILLQSPSEWSLLSLLGPASLSVFALGFYCAWLLDRKRRYLLILAGATLTYCLASLVEVFMWPRDPGVNSVVSLVLYVGSTLALIEGMLRRSGQRLRLSYIAPVMLGMTALTYYFYYVTPNLVTQIYLQNIGFGLLLLHAAFRLRGLRRGKPIDRVVYWLVVLFGLHFVPRTVATVGLVGANPQLSFANTEFWLWLQVSMAIFGGALGLTLLAAAMSDRMDDLKQDRDTDLLTGLLNRRGFEGRARKLMPPRTTDPASLVVTDIDHFKRVNDTFGHRVGDIVLQRFSLIVTECLRQGDVLARIGGEEFAVIVPRCDANGATALAERMRTTLLREPIPEIGSRCVTASFGVVEIEPNESLWQAVERADLMLYAAKEAGRNRVAMWDDGNASLTPRLTVVA